MVNSAQALRNAMENFIARRELTPTGFGRAAAGNPSFVQALMRGRPPRLATADRRHVPAAPTPRPAHATRTCRQAVARQAA